jgi:hypothetical protein
MADDDDVRPAADPDMREMAITVDEAYEAGKRAGMQAQREAAWQPIETAPKDGTLIDLWCRSFFWNADGERQLSVEFRVADARWMDDGWVNTDGNPHDVFDAFHDALQITHWQPLPAPPAAIRGSHD